MLYCFGLLLLSTGEKTLKWSIKKKGTRQATTVFGQKQRVLITSTPNLPTVAEQPEEIVFFPTTNGKRDLKR